MAWFLKTNRFVLWAFVAVIVTVPLLVTFTLPVAISERIEVAYGAVSQIPDGSTVIMFPGTYGPGGGRIFVGYSFDVVIKQLITKNCKFVFIDEYTAVNTAWRAAHLDNLIKWPDRGYTYGVDYVYLPFIPGQEMMLITLREDFQSIVVNDLYGTPISQIPMLANVVGGVDFSACIEAGNAPDQISNLIRQWGANVANAPPIHVALCAPSMISEYLPFYKPGEPDSQISGIVAGSGEAAQYEVISGIGGPAAAVVNVTSLGMLYTFFMLLITNILYIATATKKEEST
jgi:hypothetical protein